MAIPCYICLTRFVCSDNLPGLSPVEAARIPGLEPCQAAPGVHEAHFNRNMAISVRTDGGKLLGIKPGEFVGWCDVAGNELAAAPCPMAAAVWNGNQCYPDAQARLAVVCSHSKIPAQAFMGYRYASGPVVLYEDFDGAEHTLPLCLEVDNHSPTGFEWGYAGSGPHQLALAILCGVTDAATAERLHGRFCADFIARITDKKWSFPAERVRGWVQGALMAALAAEKVSNG